jgi:hypothetical protein
VGGSSSLRRIQGRQNIVSERIAIARRLVDPTVTFAQISTLAKERTGYVITVNALIKIELGIRPVYDFEVVAISAALDVPVAFLLGVSEDTSQSLPEEH